MELPGRGRDANDSGFPDFGTVRAMSGSGKRRMKPVILQVPQDLLNLRDCMSKIRFHILLAALLVVTGCGEDDKVLPEQQQQFESFLSGSHPASSGDPSRRL